MDTRKHKGRHWIVGVLSVLLGMGVLIGLMPHESLLPNAVRVAPWEYHAPEGNVDARHCWWLSAHELLFVTIDDRGQRPENYSILRYDTRTGLASHLSALEQLCYAHNGNMRPASWQLSPDGRRLLWNGAHHSVQGNKTTYQNQWFVSTLDGAQTQAWPRVVNDYAQAVWLPDSRRWIEMIDTNSSKSRMDVRQLGSRSVRPLDTYFPPWGYENYGFIAPEQGMGFRTGGVGEGETAVVQFEVSGAFAHHRTFFMHVPRGVSGPMEACVSPGGDRIAWKFGKTPGPSYLNTTSFFRHQSPTHAELWTSHLDGSDMHRLGVLPGQARNFINLQWTPDGKRLSFRYEKALYTVPADEYTSD